MTAEIPLKGAFYTVEPRFRIGPVRIGGKLGDKIPPDDYNLTELTLDKESDESGEDVGEMAKILGPGIVVIAPFAGAAYDTERGRIVAGPAINQDRELRGRLRWIPS